MQQIQMARVINQTEAAVYFKKFQLLPGISSLGTSLSLRHVQHCLIISVLL